ncbi:MAG TPA: hypothetical protein VFZ01_06080, partial [Geminicoccaceae bacterium]
SITGCEIGFSGRGIEFRSGAGRAMAGARNRIHHCRFGIRADGGSPTTAISLAGGEVTACGFGIELAAPSGFWRSVRGSGIAFARNLDADLRTSARHAVALEGGSIDRGGRRQNAQLRLVAGGATTEAPSLTVQDQAAAALERSLIQLSSGSNLNLLTHGDLVVLAGDPDDIDDFWTASKATRAGIVVSVSAQTAATATARIARAGDAPTILAGDTVRVVGRAGTASVDSVGSLEVAPTPKWILADDHCKVFAAGNPVLTTGIVLGGPDARLHHLPALGGEPAAIGGVSLDRGKVNGAFVRLHTFQIAQGAAVSFTPDATIGMVQAFSSSLALGDPIAAIFSYRTDGLGYTELLTGGGDVEVMQRTALTGTTGTVGKFTYSAHTDGKIYIENRKAAVPITVNLFVIGSPVVVTP